MKLLFVLLFLVSCSSNISINVGDCIQRIHYGEALFEDEKPIVRYAKPVKVVKLLKYGFNAESYYNIKKTYQEDGNTFTQATVKEIYRTYGLLKDYRHIDCEAIYTESVQ